jgi:vacuolar-type H+-ATPase subunit I/STV1
MRRLIRENDERKDKVSQSIETLTYIIESNKKSKYIESIEVVSVRTYEKFKTVECEFEVKGWCEDPDVGELTAILNEIDRDIYRIIRDYELDENGGIKRLPDGDTYLMFLLEKVNWDMHSNNINITYHVVQDDFRDE